MTDQDWLTVEDVAERLKVHPETVRRWLRDGRMRGYRISRRGGWRIGLAEVDRFVREESDLKLAA